MNTRQKERANRIIYIKEYIVNHSKEGLRVGYKEIIGKLMTTKYISYRTAKEDVDGLIFAGFCEKKDDEVFIPEKAILDNIFKIDDDDKNE